MSWDRTAASSPVSRARAASTRAPDEPVVVLVVSTRQYPAIDLISMLVENRFTSVERGAEDVLPFLGRFQPQVVIAVVDATNPADLDLLRAAAAITTAHILVIVPNGEADAPALRAGADIVVRDSVGLDVVRAQLEAIRRRLTSSTKHSGEQVVRCGSLLVNTAARLAAVGDAPVRLTDTEFSLLANLVQHAGHVLSPVEVAHQMTGRVATSHEAAGRIKVHVRRLRQKLDAAGYSGESIATVRGRGYRFDPDP